MSIEAPNYDRIWLQPFADDGVGHTWCSDRQSDDDIEYVRADKLGELAAALRIAQGNTDAAIEDYNDIKQENEELREALLVAEAALADRDKEIAGLVAEMEHCHTRLKVSIPLHEREKLLDRIEARDATIREQDEQIFALRKWRQEYVGKLTIAEAALAEKDEELKVLRVDQKACKEIIQHLIERAETAEAKNAIAGKALTEKDKEIEAAKHDIERQLNAIVEQDGKIAALENALAEKDKEIAELKRRQKELELELSGVRRSYFAERRARNAGGKDV